MGTNKKHGNRGIVGTLARVVVKKTGLGQHLKDVAESGDRGKSKSAFQATEHKKDTHTQQVHSENPSARRARY